MRCAFRFAICLSISAVAFGTGTAPFSFQLTTAVFMPVNRFRSALRFSSMAEVTLSIAGRMVSPTYSDEISNRRRAGLELFRPHTCCSGHWDAFADALRHLPQGLLMGALRRCA